MSNYAISISTAPLAPCEPRRVSTSISHSSEQGTLPTASLISKQVVAYQTHGSTCCLGVSDKLDHLTDSNRLHHSKYCLNHSIEPHHGHLTSRRMEDQHSQHSTSHSQHHKDGKTCTTLKTAGLSNTTNHKNPILKYEA
jgi:hypothetical protein